MKTINQKTIDNILASFLCHGCMGKLKGYSRAEIDEIFSFLEENELITFDKNKQKYNYLTLKGFERAKRAAFGTPQ